MCPKWSFFFDWKFVCIFISPMCATCLIHCTFHDFFKLGCVKLWNYIKHPHSSIWEDEYRISTAWHHPSSHTFFNSPTSEHQLNASCTGQLYICGHQDKLYIFSSLRTLFMWEFWSNLRWEWLCYVGKVTFRTIGGGEDIGPLWRMSRKFWEYKLLQDCCRQGSGKLHLYGCLFNDSITGYNYVALVLDEWVGMEHWWNDGCGKA